MNYLKNLKARHWSWVAVLAIVGIWWPVFVVTSPPEFLQQSIDPGILTLCMIVAIFGTSVKILGYLASQLPDRLGVIGVSVELAGLTLAVVGPSAYILASVFGFFAESVTVSFSSAFILACGVLVMYIHRAIIIVPRFFFEAHDSAKDEA